MGQIGDPQVLGLQRGLGVQQHDDDLGEAHRAQPVRDRQLLQLLGHLGLLAHPGGVEQDDGRLAPLEGGADGVAGDAGLRPREHLVLAQDTVDEGGLARVGAAHDGDPHRAVLAALGRRAGGRVGRDLGEARAQLVEAHAVLARQRDRLSEAQREGVVEARIGGLALVLVGGQHHRAAALLADQVGQLAVQRGDALARVHEEQRDVRRADRALGQRAHPARQAVVGLLLEACGVDDGEAQVAQAPLALAQVAGDAGAVVHQRQPLADEAVEQGGLAHVGPPDDGEGEAHGRAAGSARPSAAPRPPRPSSARRSCRWRPPGARGSRRAAPRAPPPRPAQHSRPPARPSWR